MLVDKFKTFAIHTLGCKVNLYESEAMANELRSLGLIELDFNTKADIYIINTCSVTNVADAKSRNIIARAKRKNKDALVIVAGCYSQVASQEIKNKLNVDIIIGNKFKNNLCSLIEQWLKKHQTLIKIDNLLLEKEFEEINLANYEKRTRAFIKIQDGCNFMCSYCSIPFTRGKQRSAPLNKIINDIKQFNKNGFQEIVLTGVNTAGYLDQDNHNFYSLLKSIKEIDGTFRVRISSLEPFQITDEMIELITNNPERFCNHWHICLQAGCDKTLKNMNRKYTCDDFKKIIEKIRSKSANVSISTDVIVGFPTETEDDFIKSYNFIKQMNFSTLHVFPYSKRKATAANNIKNIVKSKEKSERVQKMIFLSNEMNKKYVKQFINKEIEVIFEKEENNTYVGKSSEYLNVASKNSNLMLNKITKLKVDSVINNLLICK